MHKTQVVVTVNSAEQAELNNPAASELKGHGYVTAKELKTMAPIEIDMEDAESRKHQFAALHITWKDVRPLKVGGIDVQVYLIPADPETIHFLRNEIGKKVQKRQRESGRYASLEALMEEGFDKPGFRSTEDEAMSEISVNRKPFTEQLKKRNPVLAEVLNHRLDDKKTEPKEIAKAMNRKYDTVLHDMQKIREEWAKFKASHPDD